MLGLGANISANTPVGVVGVSSAYYIADFNNDTINSYNSDVSVVDAEGETGVLALSNSSLSSITTFFRDPFNGIIGGKTYSITLEYFVPTASPLTDLDVYKNYGYQPLIDGNYTKNQWNTVTVNFTSSSSSNYSFLNFRSKASTDTYAGDLIYIKNVTVENVAAPPVSGLNPAPAYIDLEIESAAYPAAAYSLRTLFSFSPTYLIRVRRASDNAEQDIGFDYTGSLDTTALSTFCAGTDGFVVRWYDQSGNGNDAVQATTSAQPKVYDSVTGVVTENGRAAVYFTSSQVIYRTLSANHTGDTYFVGVFKKQNSTFRQDISNDPWVRYNNDATIRTNEGSFASTGLSYVSGWHIFSLNVSGTDYVASENGVLGNPYLGSSISMSRYQMNADIATYGGATNAGTTVWHEYIIYNSDQSSNRAAIESNINDYYTIY